MSTNKSVAKSATLIGVATLSSRLLGFIRDIVIARLFGVYIYAQAYVVAFKIPNLLRDFVAEGAANAAFVPVFSEYSVKHTKEEFWELANVILNLLLLILTAITILGIIFSPIIVRLIAPGFVVSPEKLAATVKLTRIIFPYILLISLAAYSMAILNSLKHFSVPAFAPCLLNISIIVFTLIFGEDITGLAAGILVGGTLQLAVQVPVLYKKGFRLQFFKRFSHPAAKLAGRLMLPRIFNTGIYQLNNFVDSIFGSLSWIVGEAGVAVLYFSYRLIQFPLGIFSTALSTALLPTFSTQALQDNRDKLKATLMFSLRAIFFVMLPTQAAFLVLGRPIISTLFEGGRFDAASTQLTADALSFYSVGLFAYAATKILQSCFFSLKDTVTPTKVAFLALMMNIILNSILMFPLKIAGLALATSISGITSCLILFFLLRRKIGALNLTAIFISFLKILLASLGMAVVCFYLAQNLILNKFLKLAVLISLGLVSYIIFCFIFRVSEMRELWQCILKKK